MTLLPLVTATSPAAAEVAETRITGALEALENVVETTPAKIDPEILQRPLFVPARRPSAEHDQEKVATPAGGPAGLLLEGIVQTETDGFALIRARSEKKPRRVRPGDRLSGWKVKAILTDRVVLEADGERHELQLYRYPPAANRLHRETMSHQRQRSPLRRESKTDHGKRP